MGHETRLKIVDFLKENPGTNGGDIARAVGFSKGAEILGDIYYLRKYGVIRRDGNSVKARWFWIEEKPAPLP
ncbi:MAG: winged helix-turn-helix transcriptional regulator, partial [Patescibacteria group bacterium]|nr:winged helix-turn-helix transcriptional regulator [Patescibacteria group bacterium]